MQIEQDKESDFQANIDASYQYLTDSHLLSIVTSNDMSWGLWKESGDEIGDMSIQIVHHTLKVTAAGEMDYNL